MDCPCEKPGFENLKSLGKVRDLRGEECGLDPEMKVVECILCGKRWYKVNGVDDERGT